MAGRAITVGSLNYDIFFETNSVPIEGIAIESHGSYFDAGGKAANQAAQLARLGCETYLIGHVGHDVIGDYLLSRAQDAGVDTTHVTRVDAPTGVGVTFRLPEGLVAGAYNPGSNACVTVADVEAAEELFCEGSLLVLQMETPLEVDRRAIELAKDHGCTILMNTAPSLPLEDEWLAACNYLVFNEHEAAFYLGSKIETLDEARTGVRALAHRFGTTCIITLGEQGCVICAGDELIEVPARKVEVLSALGAGDSFVGGLGYAILEGMDIHAACEFATKCSSITIQSMGAQEGVPTLEQVKALG